uniref:Uncharacterized protein n=1 Tax=Avena sativa TaxID=4498 RepID=A0ACD5Y2C5_AVESA
MAMRGLLLVFIVALWCSALRCVVPDLAADRAALLAFRAAVGPGLPWDLSASSPCGWRGVRCANATTGGGEQRVVALQLPGNDLIGQVPPGTVGNLTALTTLSLHSNALSGGIPADIGNCAELRYLYLQGNRLAGEIPDGFFSLALMQRLVLSNNRIAGRVSPEFNKLTRLATLYLENNDLNGTLPPDLDLPKLALFNVSGNQLDGPVPASLAGRPASEFSGTGLCGAPLSPCAGTAPPPPPSPLPPPSAPAAQEDSKNSKLSTAAIAGIAVTGAVVVLLVVFVVIFLLCFRRRKTKADTSTETAATGDDDASPETVSVARWEKSEAKGSRSRSAQMTAATSNARKLVFVGGEPDVAYELESLLHASAEVLGKGWLGTTYRATLEGGVAVVTVKRLRELPIPEKEFRGTVAALGALRHDNLVPLRSYFYSKEEKLIVYDFVRAKGLSALLHCPNGGATCSLDFAARARIAQGCARGLAFMHGAGSSHGNIKSSNVLVTDARDGAYLTDYGLVQLVGAGVPLKRVTGYRAPEVTDPRRASREADVYSFGVLLLELLTGKAPANSIPGSDGAADLPQWVRTVVQEEWTGEVFDAAIANEARVEEEMVRLLQLATDCTEQRADARPVMADVAARIEDIVGSAQRKAGDSDEFHSVSADHSEVSQAVSPP